MIIRRTRESRTPVVLYVSRRLTGVYTATRTRKNRRADTQTTVAPDVTIRRASCRAKHTRDSIPRALNYPRRNSLRRPRWLWGSAEQQIIFSVSSGGRDPGLSGPAKTHGVCDPPPPNQQPNNTATTDTGGPGQSEYRHQWSFEQIQYLHTTSLYRA